MLKCDFNKVAKQLIIEITLRHGCSPVTLLHIFVTPFSKNNYGVNPSDATLPTYRVSQMGTTCEWVNLGKMAKNSMKITKSTFWGAKTVGDMEGGQANFLGSGAISPSPPPLGKP